MFLCFFYLQINVFNIYARRYGRDSPGIDLHRPRQG